MPHARIAEDYLRILRFFRFHAAYGEGAPDAAGLAGLHRRRARASMQLSRERVRMEMLKLLLARARGAGARGDDRGGPARNGARRRAAAGKPSRTWSRSKRRCGSRPIRYGGSARSRVFVVEDAERLRERLRLANAEHERLASMADGWWRVSPADGEASARELLYRLGAEKFTDRVLLAWSRSPAGVADAGWRALATLPERWTRAGISAQGRGFHRARRGERAAARRCVARGREGVDCGGISARCESASGYRGSSDSCDLTASITFFGEVRMVLTGAGNPSAAPLFCCIIKNMPAPSIGPQRSYDFVPWCEGVAAFSLAIEILSGLRSGHRLPYSRAQTAERHAMCSCPKKGKQPWPNVHHRSRITTSFLPPFRPTISTCWIRI